ncbi:spermidine synthase [Variovorax sp. HJSM1_2]|uniref:spermidine synthase n=1 Tax=Variovorax sp. HJSM1_2 TaxID=3366263 RepID=UPI003BD06D3B
MTVATAPRRKISGETAPSSPPDHAAIPRATSMAWPALLLFASGLAALVYQVLWIKQLSLVVGVEVHAVAVGISAFFGGLALGGWLFGKYADQMRRPYLLCAGLEAGIALLAVAATFALGASAAPFAWLEEHASLAAWVLPIVLVALPACLMGGTLPVLTRALAPQADALGAAGGRLYAANTAGAIAGALLAAFLLIPVFGIRGSALVAAALNLLIALGAWAAARRVAENTLPPVSAAGTETAAGTAAPAPRPARARLALGLYAVAGGLALGYEVVWSQAIVQFMSTRSVAFAIVLATYLAGLMIGSAWQARRADQMRDPWGVFGLLIAAAGLSALLLIAGLGEWLLEGQAAAASAVFSATGSAFAAMSARFTVAALCIVFLPTLLLGAAFPLAVRLTAKASRVGHDVGSIVALNTAGGIIGTLLTGFVLVPLLGLVHSLAALAVAAAAVGTVAAWQVRSTAPLMRWATLAVAGVALLAAWATPTDRLATLLVAARGGTLLSYEESQGGTVAVVQQQAQGHSFKRLYIQGVSNSGDSMTSQRYMRLQALLPLIIHREEPRSALVIGLGTGITAGSLLAWPGLEQRVVAELLPAVVRAARQFDGNLGVAGLTGDGRIDIRVRDGRRELLRNVERYDVVTLEPPPPSAAGVVNLYSSDFYRLAAARLQPGGIVAQWLPLPTQNLEDSQALVRSFLDVFPHASLWSTELHEMLLVGSLAPLVLDAPRMKARFAQPEVRKILREVGIDSAASLMATYVADRAGLERFAGDAKAVTDDRPGIEYASWVRRDAFPQTLDALYAQLSEPPLEGADAAFITDVKAERERLITFYSAGLHAYEGNRDAWTATIRRVLAADNRNPYYRWFVGNGTPPPPER